MKPQDKSPSPGEGHPPHVLVVDDEPGVRRLAARALEGEGYQVHTAKDGVEALEVVGTLQPCAVLGKPFSVKALVGEVRRCLEVRP